MHSIDIATPENLSEESIRRYRQDGFIHVPNVLTREEVDEFLHDAREQLHRQQKVSWDDPGGNVMDWVADVELKSRAMRRLALHPGITGIAQRLAGQPLRLFKTELLQKRSEGSTETPLHVDDYAFPFTGAPVTLTAWVALVDVPVERGCMTFIPGSHLLVDPLAGSGQQGAESAEDPSAQWSEAFWNPLAMWPELVWAPRVTVPLRAGDCTFHHSRLVHMAGMNATDVTRVSLATVYMDAQARFDAERYFAGTQDGGEEYQPDALAGLKPGQPLDGERFPRVGDAHAASGRS